MSDDMSIALPFDIPAKTDKQGSLDAIATAVETVIRFPLGHLHDNPDFGARDYTFRSIDADLVGEIRRAVVKWVPDAEMVAEERPEEFNLLIRRIILKVQGTNA